MALTVNFWIFSKRENSTAIPVASPVQSFHCELKSDSGVLSPVLEIGLPMSTNPAVWNYAQIPSYYRYYRVIDWQWSEGLWLCSLQVDPLASWRSHIGASSHYVLRSSYAHNPNAVDDFYPPLCWRPNYYKNTADFGFSQSLAEGYYVVGIAAKGNTAGPVSYYILTAGEISDLVNYMLRSTTDQAKSWTNPFTGVTDLIYRSIYSPFDYIKSCKWFPLGSPGPYNAVLRFGNYDAVDSDGNPECTGTPLGRNAAAWPSYTATLNLPSGWLSLEGKYRSTPYAHLYIVFNPFGVIELNPLDFTDSTQIILELLPDYISGDALLKIYKKVGTENYFITQRTTRLCVDINLTAASADYTGAIGAALGVAGSTIGALTAETGVGAVLGAISASAGVASLSASLVPTISSSSGTNFGGARSMEGTATLIYVSTYFAGEDNDDFGKPLLETRTLNTLYPGFIKCADGHIEIPGFSEEIQQINEALTGGFFYE